MRKFMEKFIFFLKQTYGWNLLPLFPFDSFPWKLHPCSASATPLCIYYEQISIPELGGLLWFSLANHPRPRSKNFIQDVFEHLWQYSFYWHFRCQFGWWVQAFLSHTLFLWLWPFWRRSREWASVSTGHPVWILERWQYKVCRNWRRPNLQDGQIYIRKLDSM